MEQKLCRVCGKLKDIDNFAKNEKMVDGHRNECRECHNKLYNDKEKTRERNLDKEIKTEGKKNCRICNTIKPLFDFHIKRGTPDGHRGECKECVKSIQNKYKSKPGFKEKQKKYDKKRYNILKEDILERKREYHIENKEIILEKKKEYRNKPENKERTKEYLDKYRIDNKESLKEWRQNNKILLAEIQKRYRKNNPYCVAWRSVLHSTLKRLGTLKEEHTVDMLGYSAAKLKHHIEKQFTEGMTWDNYGKWHIDHIIPVTSFNINTDIKIVCALENLQPLWAHDNLVKYNKSYS
jgi:hypothetical protein